MSNFPSQCTPKDPLKSVKKKFPLAHVVLISLLILLIAIGAIPGYLNGQWSWRTIPKIANIQPLKNLTKNGLTLPSWNTIAQQEIILGGNQWSFQIIDQGQETTVTLLLMPQDYYLNKPEVEWTDVSFLEPWKTDSHTTLKFTTTNPTGKTSQITARYFRAWKRTTAAVIQWYAWPGGGHFSPSRWFWLDQWAQLHQQRLPWVAVCLQIPISPLTNLKANEKVALSLAKTIQTTLEEEVLQPALKD